MEPAVKQRYIPKPAAGRQLVIPDIHGCSQTFRALLAKVELQPQDQLFLLGDYINRGPDNVGVIQTILDLQAAGFSVFPLRGNHEQMAIDSHARRLKEPSQVNVLASRRMKPKGLVDEQGLLLPSYLNFFQSLPYYYELDDYFLVHAGFDFSQSQPLLHFEAMLWTNTMASTSAASLGKQIVRGHVTQGLPIIKEEVSTSSPIISLDNGCYRHSQTGMGNLLCLDLTHQTLTIQPYQEHYS